eukprot:GHRQ01033539.1.p3 GENE.GHRQ01033539.1~~GHRQ01033539.1.p3  ORF type:complete len:110 (+),score=45.70 GHRQ01033539.1:40-330(+)
MQQQDGGIAAAAAANAGDAAAGGDSLLLSEQVKPRQGLPPLMVNISERWVVDSSVNCQPLLLSMAERAVRARAVQPQLSVSCCVSQSDKLCGLQKA